MPSLVDLNAFCVASPSLKYFSCAPSSCSSPFMTTMSWVAWFFASGVLVKLSVKARTSLSFRMASRLNDSACHVSAANPPLIALFCAVPAILSMMAFA
ncbi:hypothetical protein D3C87_1633990 [compost metagenome]